MVRRAMRLRAVMEATGYGRSTIYEKVQQGKFPKPTKLDPAGKAVVWFEDEIAEFQKRATTAAGKAA